MAAGEGSVLLLHVNETTQSVIAIAKEMVPSSMHRRHPRSSCSMTQPGFAFPFWLPCGGALHRAAHQCSLQVETPKHKAKLLALKHVWRRRVPGAEGCGAKDNGGWLACKRGWQGHR